MAVRGSVSTGFRAPHLAQQWFSSTATNFIGGVPFENKTFPVTDPVARALGAQPLNPETSLNESVGFTWQPIEAFTSSIDFYQIEIDDRVVLSSNFTGAAGQPVSRLSQLARTVRHDRRTLLHERSGYPHARSRLQRALCLAARSGRSG